MNVSGIVLAGLADFKNELFNSDLLGFFLLYSFSKRFFRPKIERESC